MKGILLNRLNSRPVMRALSVLLTVMFMVSASGIADASVLPYMPEPGQMIASGVKGELPYIVGMRFSSQNIFNFSFILNKAGMPSPEIQPQMDKIGKYFLAALTIPEKDIWVNLSPYEQNRIINPSLGLTDLGKDMLGEDYVLKQLAASLTHPDSSSGKTYWGNAGKVDLTKIWIVPGAIKMTEADDRAVITQALLKVSCQDNSPAMKTMLPMIEKEVNEGKNFAQLRQLYHSIIMAAWFKKKLKNTVLNQVYFNQHKIKGADTNDPKVKEKIYNEYVKAFKQGVYNTVKKERVADRLTRRQYFSGGVAVTGVDAAVAGAATGTRGIVNTETDQAAPGTARGEQGLKLEMLGSDGQPLALGQAQPSLEPIGGFTPLNPKKLHIVERYGFSKNTTTDASIDAVLVEKYKDGKRPRAIQNALKIAEDVREQVRAIRGRIGDDDAATRPAAAMVLAELEKNGIKVSNMIFDWERIVAELQDSPYMIVEGTAGEILAGAIRLHKIGAERGLGYYTPEDIKAKLKGATDLGLTPAAAYALCRAEALGGKAQALVDIENIITWGMRTVDQLYKHEMLELNGDIARAAEIINKNKGVRDAMRAGLPSDIDERVSRWMVYAHTYAYYKDEARTGEFLSGQQDYQFTAQASEVNTIRENGKKLRRQIYNKYHNHPLVAYVGEVFARNEASRAVKHEYASEAYHRARMEQMAMHYLYEQDNPEAQDIHGGTVMSLLGFHNPGAASQLKREMKTLAGDYYQAKYGDRNIPEAYMAAEKVRNQVLAIRGLVAPNSLTDIEATRLVTALVLAKLQKDGIPVDTGRAGKVEWARVVSTLQGNPQAQFSQTIEKILFAGVEAHRFGRPPYKKADIIAKAEIGKKEGMSPAAVYACMRANAWGGKTPSWDDPVNLSENAFKWAFLNVSSAVGMSHDITVLSKTGNKLRLRVVIATKHMVEGDVDLSNIDVAVKLDLLRQCIAFLKTQNVRVRYTHPIAITSEKLIEEIYSIVEADAQQARQLNTGGLDFATVDNIQVTAQDGGVKLSGKEAVGYLLEGKVVGARLVPAVFN